MLLVEDAEVVECDIETDFDEALDFDDMTHMRSCREDNEPLVSLVEIPAGTAGSGGGCVVETVV